ncbi:MAG: leucine-rich repeat domain-containing protein, partial [bacterium]
VEAEEIVRVRPGSVDLTAHKRLVALPAELRACAGRVQRLAVLSGQLEDLPAWLGELTGLTELRVDGRGHTNGPLRELPKEVGQLTRLQTLDLSRCSGLMALPAELWALTGLGELDLSGCSGLTALPAGLVEITDLDLAGRVADSRLPGVVWVTGRMLVRGGR